jgi:hypothetical protein
MHRTYRDQWKRFLSWLTREEHREKARVLRAEINRAFTEHPEDTGETYWQHLWFTSCMSARFLFTTIVIMIHGIFPFLLTRTASNQIDRVYKIIQQRIPKSRRETMDADYHV